MRLGASDCNIGKVANVTFEWSYSTVEAGANIFNLDQSRFRFPGNGETGNGGKTLFSELLLPRVRNEVVHFKEMFKKCFKHFSRTRSV